MSGFLEVLGAVSAALSVLKASKTVIEAIQERREFEGHVDRALAVAGTLRWRWDSLSAYLEEARRDGLDDSRLAEHASTMEKKLGEASELVRGLLNRGGTAANVKILLGFGAGRLQRLRFCLEQLVDDLQTMEMVFLGWSTTDLRRRMSRSISLPVSPIDGVVRYSTGSDRSDSESPPPDNISRATTLALESAATLQRSNTVASSSPSTVKSKSAPSVILTGVIVPEKVLLRDGVKQLEDPSKVLVSGARTEPLLHWLIKRCKAKEIVYLVRERALDVNTVDSSNLTPLYHAVNMLSPERVEVVRSLVKKGANFGGKRPPILTGSKKKEVSLILQRVKCV